MSAPTRILTAVPICDGHDSAINTINLEFVRQGIEVIYLGYNRGADEIARAAIQEGVAAIGLSSYNGGHVGFFCDVLNKLKERGSGQIGLFGGGGGTISKADEKVMARRGVDRIFFPGTPLEEMVEFVKKRYGDIPPAKLPKFVRSSKKPHVIGVAGPGGAGKTTLIDELVLRFLKSRPNGCLAILTHDPSSGAGALLGDRATMIYSQHDRVFMRSLATRGRPGGLAPESEQWLGLLKRSAFDLILIETVGIGQEAIPFQDLLVDLSIFVLSPGYGSKLQLQKIAMLDSAQIVVLNKSDQPGAKTALVELNQRLSRSGRVISTTAKQHRNAGVDELFEQILK